MKTMLMERSVGSTMEMSHLASRFLSLEAKLLDERRYDEWLDMLGDQITYEVPIRLSRREFVDETKSGCYHICDNKELLKLRVARFHCGEAWAERPASRTLRVVGSVLVNPTDEEAIFEVDSALLLCRQRNSDRPCDTIAVRRSDRISLGAERPLLLSRRAIPIDTVLHTPNLSVFV
ncbi:MULTISPECIES: aromatic-ring-hydroxylating dioxygenase subunit beta [Alphaproteobacteria]|mgnify:CR=1 FL=1|jgi:3-phenylpropionate/cinnamic acid dioxygenase small subunit|nr:MULTISPECIES: aromatic-ring-hydroxylating dioxygenase subunit beta [Sphingomonadaceae]